MRKKTLEVAYPEVIYFDKFADLRDYMITATIKKLDDIKAELSEPDFGANGSLQSILNYETELKIHLEKSKVKHYEEICDLIEEKINNVEEPKAILFYESDVIKAWEDLHSREKRFLSDQSVKACPELPEVIRKPYFWGNIQENEVAELGRLNDGKYLIKWSDTAQGKKQNEYVTNLRLYLTPGRISTFTKFVIYGNETKGYWIVKKPTTYFPTIQELIEHYSKGGGTLTEKNLSLISPIDNYHRAVCEHYCLTKKSGYFIREGLYRKKNEQTHVAVTEVTKHSSEDLMSEFRAIRSNTRQDNLIQVLDILVTDYQFKIISEFKKGIKLSEYLREQKDQLGNLELLDISKQVANGLAHLHELKCIHGRLKARSCLFNIDTKLVKITGFGTYKCEY
ncbi:uncharacterized protein TRIADDRAFT_60255 [Trichoplax adhaerens]|uniref:Non-specific protein-tyrosine kinase n=1 Tax=Trichoplax adhaerens TaxID=10228 RepID=B3S7Q6_TRIAD|nr:hypothetical protein TRIADDRAFT_60255 [Trichoplax adhaerens]EDV21236.1 hypothetical protein TRIADDRAFT_60255 [Trichoplax adhaerens]|eukprot:XP_002116203.1 hypothetical protein TRIADDRAFT_60255 [Trichoplax adhaerens]